MCLNTLVFVFLGFLNPFFPGSTRFGRIFPQTLPAASTNPAYAPDNGPDDGPADGSYGPGTKVCWREPLAQI